MNNMDYKIIEGPNKPQPVLFSNDLGKDDTNEIETDMRQNGGNVGTVESDSST